MNKAALIILDGWGLGAGDDTDAIAQANTPRFDELWNNNPKTTLVTYGENVGLPHGQMGNSEVGHLNIGAGRIVYQDLLRINKAIADGSLDANPVINRALQIAKDSSRPIHFMGLLSEGGVHSSQSHLHHLLKLAWKHGVSCRIHAFTDGRDTDPHDGVQCVESLLAFIDGTSSKLASVIGRYYAMDRDKRWERIKKAYDLLTKGVGNETSDIIATIRNYYENDLTDEFLPPTIIRGSDGLIQPGDVVICFNFRTDRCRQITYALTQSSIPDFDMQPLDLHYVTMTRYDDTFGNVDVIFEKDHIKNTLGEHLSKLGLTQLRAAETEKYPHVTFFFSGGREEVFDGESRIMVNSPKVATYDLKPEMSAPELTNQVILRARNELPDFICLNYANPDMVGHTGVFKAIVEAVEATDTQLGKTVDALLPLGYKILIVADHGNADKARNDDGSPNTAHTMNPVPCILAGEQNVSGLKSGILADVAPTLLKMMQLIAPDEMTGNALF